MKTAGSDGRYLYGTQKKNLTQLPERNLDVLRAIAVLCVVADHFAWPFTNGALYPVGLFGVYLFFVHTSLVLMSSLERSADSAGSPGRLVSTFYLRRAFRIYPLAWAALGLVILFHIPLTVENLPPAHSLAFVPPTRAELVTNFLLMQNVPPWVHRSILGVLWSLPIEVQMYVLLPGLWWVARKKDGALLVAALIPVAGALGLAWHARILAPLPVLWRTPSVVYYAPCFLSGVLAYAILRRHPVRTAPLPAPAWFGVLIAVGTIFAIRYPRLGPDRDWHGWFACIALGLLIPTVRQLPVSTVTRAAHQVAKYSYGVYLLHVPAQWVGMVVLADEPWAVRWSASAALAVVLPVIAYHAIESPCINLGTRLAKGRMGRSWLARSSGAVDPAP